MYKKIKTKEELPLKGGYYTIETDRVYGKVHWSVEEQIWTLEDGTKWEAQHPNYWLKMETTMEKFTKEDMVKFGEYLLSKKRKERLKDNPTSVPYKDRKRDVHDADFANWEDDKKLIQ